MMATDNLTHSRYNWRKGAVAAYVLDRFLQYDKEDVKGEATLQVQIMNDMVDESDFVYYVEMLIWDEDYLDENGNGDPTQIILSSSGEKISPYIFDDENDTDWDMIGEDEYKVFSKASDAISAAEEWLDELLDNKEATLGREIGVPVKQDTLV